VRLLSTSKSVGRRFRFKSGCGEGVLDTGSAILAGVLGRIRWRCRRQGWGATGNSGGNARWRGGGRLEWRLEEGGETEFKLAPGWLDAEGRAQGRSGWPLSSAGRGSGGIALGSASDEMGSMRGARGTLGARRNAAGAIGDNLGNVVWRAVTLGRCTRGENAGADKPGFLGPAVPCASMMSLMSKGAGGSVIRPHWRALNGCRGLWNPGTRLISSRARTWFANLFVWTELELVRQHPLRLVLSNDSSRQQLPF